PGRAAAPGPALRRGGPARRRRRPAPPGPADRRRAPVGGAPARRRGDAARRPGCGDARQRPPHPEAPEGPAEGRAVSAVEVPRSLARRLYPALRRCYPRAKAPRPPAVEFSAGLEGILARVAHPEVSVAYRHPGPLEGSGPVRLPLAALADFEG